MDYDGAVQYIQNLTVFGYNFGLDRITELLRRFDNPHNKLKVIHVGGTNGKGSTSAMICSILKETGFRVGLYTSPHLHSYLERFAINGVTIDKKELSEIVNQMKPHLDDMVDKGFEHPTEFEVSTALAFIYFHQKKVDFVVLEVGLGGSIDSTNVVNPEISIITNVSMDHMDYLGNSIKEIAGVKAGIIKEKKPLVTAATGEALEVILDRCRELGAPVFVVGRDVKWQGKSFDRYGQYLDISGLLNIYRNLYIPLMGQHQMENAAVAVTAIEVLVDRGVLPVHCAIGEGLAKTIWPARLEVLSVDPMTIVDAAHNYEGAVTLRRTLDEYFADRKIILILGMLGDKERAKVVSELAPGAAEIIITKPNGPRAGDCGMLAEQANIYVEKVKIIENIVDAVKYGLSVAGAEDLLVITGSIYMVSEAREYLLGIS